MRENKIKGQKLQEQLCYSRKNAWDYSSTEDKKQAFEFCESYKEFLNTAKTEREFVAEVRGLARQNGFISFREAIKLHGKLLPGMKIYQIARKKAIILSIIGSKPIEHGVNILGSHIDSPRLDLKPVPLYQDTELALLKTHYYGGIKKYQWVTIPLAVHGIIVKTNGKKVIINIGEDGRDPVFTITDLLPHLAENQLQKKMSVAITGEDLNVLAGSIPYNEENKKEKIKLNILKLLNEKYGIVEEDLISAELEIVPAFKAKDVGFDRSMVGAYGQDARVCAYNAFKALLALDKAEKTAVCALMDKEEIGSVGNTGAQSGFFVNFIEKILVYSTDSYSDIKLRKCLNKSKMLSADVTAAVDPNYPDVQDLRNATYLGYGTTLLKYTGRGGKTGASDANAEYVWKVRTLFDQKGIIWQPGEIGKVDLGGGGTVALYFANLGIEVIDCGLALLSMHAPFEIASKIDIYVTYKAYIEFLKYI